MKSNILLIEDNLSICAAIVETLENEQFHVSVANTGEKAHELFNTMKHDLILLDLMLPDISGEDLLQAFRRKSNVPVIIISMKSSDIEKAINLGLGADDFLTKPFSMLELTARVKAVIRRSKYFEIKKDSSLYTFGDYKINLNTYMVTKNNKPIFLTNKEYEILKTLVVGHQRVFSKNDLYRIVWNEEGSENDNVLNVHINRIRLKIEDDPNHPIIIKTIWGFGYKLGVEVNTPSLIDKHENNE
jgi:DNA-binding response OmpR family regulator